MHTPEDTTVTEIGPESSSGQNVWFVTGASRGLGRAIVSAALNRGDAVIAGARSTRAVRDAFPHSGNGLLPVELDVRDEAAALAAVEAGLARFGRIDVLVNNAGYGLVGAVEEVSAVQVRELFSTNVDGLLNLTRAVLPAMRRARKGHIVNISSQGGFAAAIGSGVYAATKFAVEGLSEALALELAEMGIRVTVVEPGVFRTEFFSTASIVAADTPIADYDTLINREVALENDGIQPGDPQKAAAAILAIVDAEVPPLRLPLGVDAVARISKKIEAVAIETETWIGLSLSTGFAPEE
ncbi:SDR family NAD(P)-dependent oxidoreductase [Leucobacter sp. Z1108]